MLFYIRRFFSYISLFFFKGALSDKDIKKLLGQHIFIYPFKKENLKASSYNLTASKCAFVKEGGEGKQQLIVKDDNIIIPAGKTAIIETAESIYVSRWITGTYHSRVKLVNKGIGHIGTTLDSCYWGLSAISLQNTTDHDIPIKIGSTIVTIMFYALKSRSSGLHDNMPGRIDDNIQLGVENFYPFEDDKKIVTTVIVDKMRKDTLVDEKFVEENVKFVTDRENREIKDKSIVIIDMKNPVCESCKNCNEKENCVYKLLKNINEEEEKRKKIIEELKVWKNQSWITSKDGLIKQVLLEVKKNNIDKDALIYNLITLLAGVVFICEICVFITKNPSSDLKLPFQLIIPTIVPTVAIIIGMINNNKKKYKGE